MKTVIMLLILVVPVALCDGYETITGHTGENVTLTFPNCSSNPSSSVRVQKIGSEKHIYSCIDGHPIIPDHQDPSFVGRVEGMECPMTGGAIYVNVTGLTTNDTGLYEWFSTTSGGTKFTFYLNVTDRGPVDGDKRIQDAGVIAGETLTAAGIIIIIVFCYLYRDRLKSWMMRCRNRNQQNSEPPVTYREVNQQQV